MNPAASQPGSLPQVCENPPAGELPSGNCAAFDEWQPIDRALNRWHPPVYSRGIGWVFYCRFWLHLSFGGGLCNFRYLLQAVVEEKENRTMELLVTTISPNRLMAGKVMGIIAVGWTQLFVWFGLVVLGGTVREHIRQLARLDLHLDWVSWPGNRPVRARFHYALCAHGGSWGDFGRCSGSTTGDKFVHFAAFHPHFGLP